MTTVLYPGSFDPIHNGHVEIVETASRLFDRVVVATVHNPQKQSGLFDLTERSRLIEASLAHLDNVEVTKVSSLVVDLAKEVEASFIVKGLRAVSDFESELQMAQTNTTISGVDTLFIPSASSHSFLASKLIREIARFGGEVSAMVPPAVADALHQRFTQSNEEEPIMSDGVSFDSGYQDDDAYDTRPLASGEHQQYTASDYIDEAPADDLSVDYAEEPLDTAGYTMPRTEQLLRRVVDLIEAAPGLPMSASVRINKDEILELLDDAVARLPDELRAARWLLKERDEFLAKTRRDGEEIISDAKARVAHMVQRTEVAKAAEQRARKVTEDAEAEARRMHHEVEDYCDQKLASFEIVLERITRAVGAGRQKLSATSLAEAQLAPQEEDSLSEALFFDQDAMDAERESQ